MIRNHLWFVVIVLQVAMLLWGAHARADTPVHIDLPAQPLAQSLKAIGAATNTDVGFDANQVAGLMAPAIKADLTVDGALMRVLAGTGLRPKRLDGHTIVIAAQQSTQAISTPPLVLAQAAGPVPDVGSNENKGSEKEKDQTDELQEITVTGSHIRGEAPVGSELKVYTREDLDQSGAATLDQFARLIPQNFSNTDSVSNYASNSYFAAFSGTSENISSSAAFNIHGLGPSATLTLINGHRIAPAGADGSLVDVSQIPLSAVDHIDILSDGASAIYGSDAVAGVVNIVTRKDFDGGETGIRYGQATEGGAREVTASQLLGKSWNTGNVLLTYEYDDQGGLDASQRSYIADQGGPFSLLPESRRNSVFLSGNQAAGADTTLSAQAIYSDRATSFADTAAGTLFKISNADGGDEKLSGLTLSADHVVIRDWHVSLTGNFSELRQMWNQYELTSSPPSASPQSQVTTIDSESRLMEVDALANGSLFSIPGGPIKAALGGDFRREQFGEYDETSGINTGPPTEHRNVSSAFAEIAAPIFGRANSLPGLRRLDLSGAIRYDDYSDFGSSTNFKIGAAWEPVAGFTFKSTLGTSFQAPLLSQLYTPVFSYAYPFADATSPTGVTDTLYKLGGNPYLEPEKSRALTVGFDVKPEVVPNLQLSANYFRIDFDDRIEVPPVLDADIFTGLLAPFTIRNPPLAVVQAAFDSPYFLGDFDGQGPEAVKAIFTDQNANIAATKESGIDLTAAYRLPTEYGQFGGSLDLAHLIRNDFQTVNGASAEALLNAFGQPPKWKGRAGLTWAQGPFSASAFVNFVSRYDNTLFTPAQSISAWTTGDLYFAFKTHNLGLSSAFDKLTVALNIINFTDRRPPYVQIPPGDLDPGQNPIPFDAANASPVGRLVTLQLTKGWGGSRSSNSIAGASR
jgi:iron complex outermembrane recepter protein